MGFEKLHSSQLIDQSSSNDALLIQLEFLRFVGILRSRYLSSKLVFLWGTANELLQLSLYQYMKATRSCAYTSG